MSSLPADDLPSRLCSICLCSVDDDNTRGKAELVCGHLFHLACIGSEFNYRNEMKCPNCRVVEDGEWLIPDDVDHLEEVDEEDYAMHVTNRRVELHIFNGGRSNSSTTRDQTGGQGSRPSPPVAASTVHYHNTIVLPPLYGGSTMVYGGEPLNAHTAQRSYALPDPTRRTRADHTILQDRSAPRPHIRPDMGTYHNPNPNPNHQNSPAPTVDTSTNQRREENVAVQTNMAGHESMSSYNINDDPTLDLTLNMNASEDRSQEEQHETNENDPPPAQAQGTSDESFWFQPPEV